MRKCEKCEYYTHGHPSDDDYDGVCNSHNIPSGVSLAYDNWDCSSFKEEKKEDVVKVKVNCLECDKYKFDEELRYDVCTHGCKAGGMPLLSGTAIGSCGYFRQREKKEDKVSVICRDECRIYNGICDGKLHLCPKRDGFKDEKEMFLCKNCKHSHKYGSGMCMNSGENERTECAAYDKKEEKGRVNPLDIINTDEAIKEALKQQEEDKKWETIGNMVGAATGMLGQSIAAPYIEAKKKKLEDGLEKLKRGTEKNEKKEVYGGMGLFGRKQKSKKCSPHEWVITKVGVKRYKSDYYPFDEVEDLTNIERVCVECKLAEHMRYETYHKSYAYTDSWRSGPLSEYQVRGYEKHTPFKEIREVCTYEHALGLDRPKNEINFCANCGTSIAGLTKCNKCGFEYELV